MGDPYPGKIKYLGGKPLRLTYDETVAAVALAGWPEADWAKAVATIGAESDRCVNIYNTYLNGHFGLMQIGAKQHPAYFKGLVNAGAWTEPIGNCKYGYTIFQSQGWGAWEAASNGKYAGYLLQAKAAVGRVQTRIKNDQLAPHAKATSGPHGRTAVLQSYFLQSDGVTASIAAIQTGVGLQAVTDLIGTAAEATAKATVESGAAVSAAMQANALFGAVQMMVGAGKWIADAGNWIRVAQVVAGGGLLLAGISIVAKPVTAGVAGALPVGKIAKIAGKV